MRWRREGCDIREGGREKRSEESRNNQSARFEKYSNTSMIIF